MDQDKENPLGGMFDDHADDEVHNDGAIEISAERDNEQPEDLAAEDIVAEENFAPSEEETMVGDSDPMPSYVPPKKKSSVLPILLIILLLVAGGFVFAGDFIMQMIAPAEQPVSMYAQQDATPSMPLPVPPAQETAADDMGVPVVDEPVSDGSFSDIGGEVDLMASEENIMDTEIPAMVEDGEVVEEPAHAVEPEDDAAQNLADAIVQNSAAGMPQDGLESAAEQDSDEEKGEMDKQDLIAKILEESAKDADSDTGLNTPENSKLAEMISGEKQIDPALEILQAEGYSPTAADIVRESVVVRPKVKKLVIVERNFASSSDRALAEAANRAVANRNFTAALDLYNDILATDPTNEIAMMGKAKSLMLLGHSDDALQAYSAVIDRDPMNREALTNYFGLVGDVDPITAALELENLAVKNPKVAEIQGQLGVVYGKMKDPVRAMRAFDKAALLDPSNALYPYNSAVLADRMMNAGKAVSYYQQALAIVKQTGGNKSGLSADVIEKRIKQLYAQQ